MKTNKDKAVTIANTLPEAIQLSGDCACGCNAYSTYTERGTAFIRCASCGRLIASQMPRTTTYRAYPARRQVATTAQLIDAAKSAHGLSVTSKAGVVFISETKRNGCGVMIWPDSSINRSDIPLTLAKRMTAKEASNLFNL